MKHLMVYFPALWLLVAGCDGAGREAEKDAGKEVVDLRILDWKQTQDLVASHRGKVVVVDVWSTICAPCRKELPRMVDLHKKHGPDRVACISVSCDYTGRKDEPPEALREEVLTVLRGLNATFQNVLLNVPSDEFFTGIDLASIPAVLVYGRDGKLVKRFDNDEGLYGDEGFNYKSHITPLVEKLLAGD